MFLNVCKYPPITRPLLNLLFLRLYFLFWLHLPILLQACLLRAPAFELWT